MASFFSHSQIKSADDQAQKDKFAKGAKKSVEAGVYRMHALGFLFAYLCCLWSNVHLNVCVCVCLCAENQLNELEQRLAQTERMLNSILTQLDPLTNW